jgi:MOSC domain-containing protein YiiM
MGAVGTVLSVNVSTEKGTRKAPVEEIRLRVDHGVEGDAHAGPWHRQVSLLAQESVDSMIARCATLALRPGDFAENVTTRGLRLWSLPIGTRLALGGEAVIEVTQIGKECHLGCEIRRQVGDCVMPREGIFTRVVRGGVVRPGDPIVEQGRRG